MVEQQFLSVLDRLRSIHDAPVSLMLSMILVTLAFASALRWGLGKAGRLKPALYTELRKRTRSWYVIIALIIIPVLSGPAPTVVAVTVLSLFCFSEFARATGLIRDRFICLLVTSAIVLTNLVAYSHSFALFEAVPALAVTLIAALAILNDSPHGYIQRVGLGLFGFMFFGYGLGYLSYMTNDPNYRALLIMLLIAVEINDVYAYISGRLFGRKKLMPHTSPNKTVAGAVGAVILTTATVCGLGHVVFAGSLAACLELMVPLGLIVSIGGQCGDLMMSSVKRDVGIKDLGNMLPGHGGVLDRFDSLVLVSPLVFHFFNYFVGIAGSQPVYSLIVCR